MVVPRGALEKDEVKLRETLSAQAEIGRCVVSTEEVQKDVANGVVNRLRDPK